MYAEQELARRISHFHDQPDHLVLGLPRGGVVVAYEIARAIEAQLDIFPVRKLWACRSQMAESPRSA
jgi:putative phosphoribosyl transferase